ncbi:hypothetical protein [Zooshikella ganghwensis]|uniref:Uncharacterized protein n=1 Tax=Zooshikella ganghwensis TaxID=202772 RepID=A0A4V1IMW2_9GAMM|nr:hypothetical protein [Zooshikella ganghwensis]RDH41621.1 hypothetical protein B9G39_27550 [Zooshikella ganghwensis]
MERLTVYYLKEPVKPLIEQLKNGLKKSNKRAIIGEYTDTVFSSRSPFDNDLTPYGESDHFFGFRLQSLQSLPSGVVLYRGDVEVTFDKNNELMVISIENRFLNELKVLEYLRFYIDFEIDHYKRFDSNYDFALYFHSCNAKKHKAA